MPDHLHVDNLGSGLDFTGGVLSSTGGLSQSQVQAVVQPTTDPLTVQPTAIFTTIITTSGSGDVTVGHATAPVGSLVNIILEEGVTLWFYDHNNPSDLSDWSYSSDMALQLVREANGYIAYEHGLVLTSEPISPQPFINGTITSSQTVTLGSTKPFNYYYVDATDITLAINPPSFGGYTGTIICSPTSRNVTVNFDGKSVVLNGSECLPLYFWITGNLFELRPRTTVLERLAQAVDSVSLRVTATTVGTAQTIAMSTLDENGASAYSISAGGIALPYVGKYKVSFKTDAEVTDVTGFNRNTLIYFLAVNGVQVTKSTLSCYMRENTALARGGTSVSSGDIIIDNSTIGHVLDLRAYLVRAPDVGETQIPVDTVAGRNVLTVEFLGS